MRNTTTIVGGSIAGFIILVGLVALALSHAQVDAGHVGVVSHWGAIDPKELPLQPGWHWIAPFSGVGVANVSIQQQNHNFKEVSTASRELQNVFVDGGINYHVTSTEAAGIEINGGLDAYLSRVFNPAFQDYIKEVIPSYTTTDILANRSKIRDAVLAKLREKANDPGVNYHVTVDDLFLTDIHFDKTYTAAIEAVAVSNQQLAQAKIDAQTKVTQAEGEASANRARQSTLTPEQLQWAAIQKWDGHLPQVTNGTPFISIQAK